ncbi:MAG: flagellar M-ring protein FliF [Clostridiaceae bacterium]|nr:flagellar M-ring protein FliF [Clostridiaceae bacterium]
MPNILKQIPQQFSEFWNNLDKSNRNKIIITSAVVFVSVLVAIFVVSRPRYEVLFSQLEPKDAGEISTELEKLNIDYRLGNNGTSIEVKKQDLDRAKVSLAEAGYPKDGLTFEDIKTTSLGTTEAERNKKYQLYKQSELERALKTMDNIKNAVVKLTIPEKSAFFNSEEKAASASVIIEPYHELTEKQIRGIERFIAGSVENLSPDDVTILDNNGNILNEKEEDDVYTGADKQYALRQQITRNMEERVKELLTGIADNVRVVANLELDFDTLVTSQEIYEPVVDGKGIIRSYSERKENLVNGTAGGVPGTDSNIPVYPNVSTNENGEYNLTDKTVNYDINKTVTQSTKEIGKMDKENSSIAVALYYIVQSDGTELNVTRTAQTPVDLDKIRSMIASATGIPQNNITVETLDIVSPRESEPQLQFGQLLETYGPIALILIIIALLVLMIFRARSQEQLEPQVEAPSFVAPVREEEVIPEIDIGEKSEIKKQIEKFVKQKPEAVAQLLRNWLADDWE